MKRRVGFVVASLAGAALLVTLAARRRRSARLRRFCKKMPKVELHAHLSGSIRPSTLLELSAEHGGADGAARARETLGLSTGTTRETRDLGECFAIFDLIHGAVRSRENLVRITREVVADFAADNVAYLELRTTPRDLPDGTTRREYVSTVVSVLEAMTCEAPGITCRLLVSIDRATADPAVAQSTVDLACEFRPAVVGVDLSGNPTKGSFATFLPALQAARAAGLHVTLHCAEVPDTAEEVSAMIAFRPDRLGHALTLSREHCAALLAMPQRIPVELCPTSNVKTLQLRSMNEHPTAKLWVHQRYPFCINTDDSGVFATDASLEHFIFAEALRLDVLALSTVSCNAAGFSFLPTHEKARLQDSVIRRCAFLLWCDWASLGVL
jgi:adenosine deaminase